MTERPDDDAAVPRPPASRRLVPEPMLPAPEPEPTPSEASVPPLDPTPVAQPAPAWQPAPLRATTDPEDADPDPGVVLPAREARGEGREPTMLVDLAAAARGGRPTRGKLALRFGEAVAGGLVAGFVLFALAPIVLGWRPYTVLTGSMRPNIQPGDVVMDQPVRIADVHVGDVVTFSDPTRGGVLVTHRVRSITRGPLQTQVETRGDANNNSERWSIKTQDRVGRVVYVIPAVGYVANAIRNPIGIILLVVLPVAGLGISVVRRIWREGDDDPADDAGDAPDR